jgi:hypothetical protein
MFGWESNIKALLRPFGGPLLWICSFIFACLLADYLKSLRRFSHGLSISSSLSSSLPRLYQHIPITFPANQHQTEMKFKSLRFLHIYAYSITFLSCLRQKHNDHHQDPGADA